MLSVFGDESHDAAKQRVYMVAGLLGDDTQWSSLREIWLERTEGKVFHAADCESGRKDYSGVLKESNEKLYRDLTRILAESGLVGFGVGIDLAGCRQYFPGVLPDHPYLKCFLEVVNYLSEKAYLCIPRDDVEFIFDRSPDREHNASLIYEYMTNQSEWKCHELLADKIRFSSRHEVGIQAADLFTRELMKRFDTYLFDESAQTRSSFETLKKTNRFGASFLCKEYFESMKAQMESLERQTCTSRPEYKAWLIKKRRIDNQTNRLTYLMEVDAEERKRSSTPT